LRFLILSFFFILKVSAQSGPEIVLHYTHISRHFVYPCVCVVSMVTGVTGPANLSFEAHVAAKWEVKGFGTYSYSESDHDFSNGHNFVDAVVLKPLPYPSFGIWDIEGSADHWIYNQVDALKTQAMKTYECELYVNCEECYEGDPPFPGDDEFCNAFPDFCKQSGGGSDNLIDACPPECTSPILIDLGYDDFSFGGPEEPVFFDLLGSGESLLIQWVTKYGNDAFLAQDINGNGIVDNGTELFGNGSRLYLSGQRHAPNGFVALGQFDDPALGGNNDGFISEYDHLWSRLYLWLDSDAEGRSIPGEMFRISETGLTRLTFIPREEKRRDVNGNWLRFWATAQNERLAFVDGFSMVDVFFARPN